MPTVPEYWQNALDQCYLDLADFHPIPTEQGIENHSNPLKQWSGRVTDWLD